MDCSLDDDLGLTAARRLDTLGKLSVQVATSPASGADLLQVLADNPHDIAFAALYLVQAGGQTASLTTTVGLLDGHSLPGVISSVVTDDAQCSLAKVLATGQKIEVYELGPLSSALAAAPGVPLPTQAVVLPILATPFSLAGLLIMGVNPQRIWDAAYQVFFDLVADQIGVTLTARQVFGAAAKVSRRPVQPELASKDIPRPPANQDLAKLASEALAINRTKDEFLAMLGHELRNSLAPILGALQLLNLQKVYSREQGIIERQVSHLTRLVDDLLDISRISRGDLELRRQRIELSTVLAKATEISSPLLLGLGQELEVQVAAQGLPLDADPDRLAQTFVNLLTNAAKYSAMGTRITLKAERVGAIIRTQVCDQGVGIAADMLDKVFDSYVQQPETLERARGGLGLGLSIVRRLVSAHGGTVSVQSLGLAKGSVFTVDLPAADDGSVAAELAAAYGSAALAGTVARASGQRILIVDDDADTAAMLKYSLQRLGYTVEVANNGGEALRRNVSFAPDIALVDIGMPGMDGYELARRLPKRHPDGRVLQLVALTGYGQDSDRQRSKLAGFAKHLVKPVDLAVLNRLLEELCPSIDSTYSPRI